MHDAESCQRCQYCRYGSAWRVCPAYRALSEPETRRLVDWLGRHALGIYADNRADTYPLGGWRRWLSDLEDKLRGAND